MSRFTSFDFRYREFFCLGISIAINFIIGIITDDYIIRIGSPNGKSVFDINELRVSTGIFQPFRVDDDAIAVEGDIVGINIAETHEHGISDSAM